MDKKYFGILKFILLLIPAVILTSGCDSRGIFDETVKIPDGNWDKNNVVKFEVNVDDTISSHNLYIHVRNASAYPFSNLYLFLTTRAPKGGILRDTVELTLADDRGKWLGSGVGDIWDIQIPYKANVRFPNKGKYKFEYVQGMRTAKLPGILDIGLRVERSK